jgi:cation transport regulator ChaC
MHEEEEWFFGYGSLIFDPILNGERLEDWCDSPLNGQIKEGIEFLHTSRKRRSNAPTLCFDGTERVINGKCWRAVGRVNIDRAKAYLRKREGTMVYVNVVLSSGRKVKALCGNTLSDLKGKTAKEIAKQAIESEKNANSGMGGVTYIKNCKKFGIKTPMLDEILQEISVLDRA